MPKKPKINKRLDNLFKDVQPEDHARGKPAKPKVQKETPLPANPPEVPSSAPAASKPAESIQAASTPVKTTRRQTGILALPPEFIAPASSDTKSAYTTTIQLGEEEWATLRMVDENQTRSYSTDEQLLIQQVSDQLSLALENARFQRPPGSKTPSVSGNTATRPGTYHRQQGGYFGLQFVGSAEYSAKRGRQPGGTAFRA
ncbi:MAG: hypothetical protein IPJ47_11020 [Anaerolineales bacterium]|nr:hypothetical protein [Anaerolineales bacterium]